MYDMPQAKRAMPGNKPSVEKSSLSLTQYNNTCFNILISQIEHTTSFVVMI